MRTAMIDRYIAELKKTFGTLRVPIDEDELELLFKAKKYAEMVRIIRSSMGITKKLTFGLAFSGGPKKTPAWLETERTTTTTRSLFGLIEKKEVTEKLTLFIRQIFIQEYGFDATVCAMAHEMAHIVLNDAKHSLRREEEAVDLTAMLFGYRDFYTTGTRTVKVVDHPMDKSSKMEITEQLGYLTLEEIRYAAHVMTFGVAPRH